MEVNVVKILNWESEFSGNSRSGICKFSCALVRNLSHLSQYTFNAAWASRAVLIFMFMITPG